MAAPAPASLPVVGFLDNLFGPIFDLGSGPGRMQKRGNRIQEEGTASPGVVTGIRVEQHSDSGADWFFGVEVQQAGQAPFRAACRQSVAPVSDSVRLGMPVDVRHDGETIVLAWDPTGPGNWKPVKGVDDGITDTRLPTLRGDPADAEVLGWRRAYVFGVERAEPEIELRIDGREQRRRTMFVPEWAGHLLAADTVVPVHVQGDKLAVDWLGAIERNGPGVGVPKPGPSEPD
jgi:hypothetical protein